MAAGKVYLATFTTTFPNFSKDVHETIYVIPENNLPQPTMYVKHNSPDKVTQASVQLKMNTKYVLIEENNNLISGWFTQDLTLDIRYEDGSRPVDVAKMGVFIHNKQEAFSPCNSDIAAFNKILPYTFHNNNSVVLEYGKNR